MKYYEAHEQEYRRRFKAGQVAWDKGDYEQFDMLPLIQKFLKEVKFNTLHPRTLDLGCGTGALAVFLAKQGFSVTAIDISPSAINEAKKQTKLRSVEVDFQVADVCQIDLPGNSFDVVIDNHFLHCIVFEEERQKVLRKIHSIINPNGQYWIETMVGHPDIKPQPEWHLDSEGITWLLWMKKKKLQAA